MKKILLLIGLIISSITLFAQTVLLLEGFESGTLNPLITMTSVGSFNFPPGIKANTNFGSTKAFGFGRSNCGASCFSSRSSTLTITFPSPTFVDSIKWKEMELFGNWGSGGQIYINGTLLSSVGMGALPYNSYMPDPVPRNQSISINQNVSVISFYVSDITNQSEIVIDDLTIKGICNASTSPTSNAGPDKNLNCTITSASIGTPAIAGNTYSWSPSTGLSSTTDAQPVVHPIVTTSYTVTVTSPNGCTSTDVVVVNMNPILSPQTWNSSLDYSIINNPNGAWSYGRKMAPHSSTFNIFTAHWGTGGVGWYLGGSQWQPSLQPGPSLWANHNSNGLPVVRWTCPHSGYFNLSSTFIGDDYRGVNVIVYVCLNDSIIFTDSIQAYLDSTQFLVNNLLLNQSDRIDFLVKWSGLGNHDYNWTKVKAIHNSVNSIIVGASSVTPTICSGSPTTITATGANTYTCNPSATPSGTSSFIVSPSTTTTYTITGTNANGCTATSTKTIIVNPLPIVTASNLSGCSITPLTLIGSPSGGAFNIPNPYTGPSTTYTYTYIDTNGCTATSTPATITNINAINYYLDNDNDSFGNPSISQLSCSQPANYVSNNLDCNDSNNTWHPNQIWFLDQDGDGYGTGINSINCEPPTLQYFLGTDLISTIGDCDDNDPDINPDAQYFQLPNPTLCTPLQGSAYELFTFEVNYFDVNNNLPPYSYPRLILDYGGDGIYTTINDRIISMIPYDITDNSTIDGKKYIANISSLPYDTNWKAHVESVNSVCTTKTNTFNYPDVLQKSDIEIFANDIQFSNLNPATSSSLTVYATIHNESDYAAENFVVCLKNQNDTTTFPNITVAYLAPQSSTTVSWNIITPSSPMYCPMEVSIDITNIIEETNELDNMAIRAFINGNYNNLGSIIATAYASPLVSYTGSTSISIGGYAHYTGTAVTLTDSSVAGAMVNFTILETGAVYSCFTYSNGNFYKPIVQPPPGVYHVQGTVSDGTFIGIFNTTFTVVPNSTTSSSPGCSLPDLAVGVGSNYQLIVQNTPLVRNIHVHNHGAYTNTPTTINISSSGDNTILNNVLVPSFPWNQNYTFNFPTPGVYHICATVDPNNIIAECTGLDNSICGTVQVLPNLPDIIPGAWYYAPLVYDCEINNVVFELVNIGGNDATAFDCMIFIKRNDTLVRIDTQQVVSIPSAMQQPYNKVQISIPFLETALGNYIFEIHCDTFHDVNEYLENNNTAIYNFQMAKCKPNFTFIDCNAMTIESINDYDTGSTITLKGIIKNNGNLAYNGPLNIRYRLAAGILFTDYTETYSVNLAPGDAVTLSKNILAPMPSSKRLTMMADYNLNIDELNENDNSLSDSMCYDFTLSDNFCSNNFWNHLQYQGYILSSLSVGVNAYHLYHADTLKVNFEMSGPGVIGLNLGDALLYNVGHSCWCPSVASIPTNCIFNDTGIYTFTMKVDPDNEYPECNDGNNTLVKTIHVTGKPDMRVFWQYIAPSKLNPQPGDSIHINVTYDNVGKPNINKQMALKVLIDDSLLSVMNPVYGLLQGDDITISIPDSFASTIPGAHIIRAIIDVHDSIDEFDETNNEATRAILIGETANLYFELLTSDNLNPNIDSMINIKAKIGNSGDLPCEADVEFFYIDNNLDTILIDTKHVYVNANDSTTIIQPWLVLDYKTTIIGRIINSSILEYTYDDNEDWFQIGAMLIAISSTPACSSSTGTLTANVIGGEAPYIYFWSNGYVGQTLTDSVGTYTVIVTDATGQTITVTDTIIPCPSVVLQLKFLLEGYYIGSGIMETTLSNQGQASLSNITDSVTVELHERFGYTLAESYHGVVKTNGTMDCYFSSLVLNDLFYIVVKHRNSIQTWSANPIYITSITSYDFTTAVNQAYGNNMHQFQPNLFALFAGDIDQDENVDLIDMSILQFDLDNFQFGYLTTDLNGDGNVDLLDLPAIEQNVSDFIFSEYP